MPERERRDAARRAENALRDGPDALADGPRQEKAPIVTTEERKESPFAPPPQDEMMDVLDEEDMLGDEDRPPDPQ